MPQINVLDWFTQNQLFRGTGEEMPTRGLGDQFQSIHYFGCAVISPRQESPPAASLHTPQECDHQWNDTTFLGYQVINHAETQPQI